METPICPRAARARASSGVGVGLRVDPSRGTVALRHGAPPLVALRLLPLHQIEPDLVGVHHDGAAVEAVEEHEQVLRREAHLPEGELRKVYPLPSEQHVDLQFIEIIRQT
jgi:hypothetical protein